MLALLPEFLPFRDLAEYWLSASGVEVSVVVGSQRYCPVRRPRTQLRHCIHEATSVDLVREAVSRHSTFVPSISPSASRGRLILTAVSWNSDRGGEASMNIHVFGFEYLRCFLFGIALWFLFLVTIWQTSSCFVVVLANISFVYCGGVSFCFEVQRSSSFEKVFSS